MTILAAILLLWLLPTLIFFGVVAFALPGVILSGRADARAEQAAVTPLAPVADPVASL